MKRSTAAFLVFLGALAVALAVLQLQRGADHSLERVTQSGTLRIAYATEPPHAFLTPGGEVTGQSAEVAKHIAQRLGVRNIEWRLVEFTSLLPELEAGQVDVIAVGMFITPERARRVQFSEPIFHVQQGLLVARGNPHGLHAYADALRRPTVKIAVFSGSVQQAQLRKAGLPEARMLQVPDAQAGLAAVESGVADGLALSSPTISWLAAKAQLDKTEPAQPFTQPDDGPTDLVGYGAFAFRQQDKALLRAWNAELAPLLASEKYRRIMSAFGFTPGEYPGSKTTREILTP